MRLRIPETSKLYRPSSSQRGGLRRVTSFRLADYRLLDGEVAVAIQIKEYLFA